MVWVLAIARLQRDALVELHDTARWLMMLMLFWNRIWKNGHGIWIWKIGHSKTGRWETGHIGDDLRAIWETSMNVSALGLFGYHAMREALGSKRNHAS